MRCKTQIYKAKSLKQKRYLKSLLESVTGHPKAWTQTRLLQLATGFGALLHYQARSESSGSLELVFHNTRVITDEIE